MQDATKETWFQLCEQAVLECDPEELFRLTSEINRLLSEKEARLAELRTGRGQHVLEPANQDDAE